MSQAHMRRIRASAGSGKTHTLTTNFINLLANAGKQETAACKTNNPDGGYGWQEILAMTFTNLAADEMRDRVVGRLKSIALNKKDSAIDLSPEEAARWVNLLIKRLSRLQIRTIDSLIDQIVRMAALDLCLSPDFTPAFNTEKSLAPLLDDLLEQSRTDNTARTLIDGVCHEKLFNDYTFKGFTGGKEFRRQTLALILPLVGSVPEKISSSADLSDLYNDLVVNIRQNVQKLKTCIDTQRLNVKSYLTNALNTCEETLFPQKNIDSEMLKKAMLSECLKKGSTAPDNEAEAAYAAVKDAVADFNKKLPLIKVGQKNAPFLKLALVLTKLLEDFFRKECIIPQSMMYHYAQKALLSQDGVPQTFCRMGTGLTHILIDEFQDTSRDQWAPMRALAHEALANGGTLTWVGDVKQAIYGWRNGDASLFEEIGEDKELRAITSLEDIKLPCNYRSCGIIVDHNNKVFSQLANPEVAKLILKTMLPNSVSDKTIANEADMIVRAFADTRQKLPESKPHREGYVRLQTIESGSNEALEQEVQKVLLDTIDELHDRNHRPYGDIAVLVRANKDVAQIAQWFIEKNIPVITENSFLLAKHPIVKELISFLTFINTPDDDTAFWGIASGTRLAQEYFGLSPHALQAWICTRPENNRAPLWKLFRKDFSAAWDAFFAPFHQRAELVGAYDAVFEILARCRIRHGILPEDTLFAERFLEILYLAETNGQGCISAFLDYWTENGGEERAPMPESVNAVRIMTIHKSKGCEFPVVILPWIGIQAKPQGLIFHQIDKKRTILAPPIEAMGDEYNTRAAAAVRESLHLLYVAWTRPKEELYAFLTFAGQTKEKQVFDILLDSMLDSERFESGTQTTFTTEITNCKTAKAADPSTLRKPEAIQPQEEHPQQQENAWHPMGWLPALKIFRNPIGELHDTAATRGTLLHRCLEMLTLTGDPQTDAQRAIDRGMEYFPGRHDINISRDELVTMIAWYAGLPETSHWLRFGTAEQSLIDNDGSIRRADLLVNDGQTVTIIDYKTGNMHNSHLDQIKHYKRISEAAQPLPVHGVLVYLDLKKCIRV